MKQDKKKNKVFIIHGINGHPNKNWFPWLKDKLEKTGCTVVVPEFPIGENLSFRNWINTFNDYKELLNKDTIAIGHSLGVVFLLNILELYQLKCAFLIAGFISPLENEPIDTRIKSFIKKKYNWKKIKKNCEKFYIIHSDNDPVVDLKKAYELSELLDTEVKIIKNVGHFSQKTGFFRFDYLYNEIIKII
ncbi:alpha/beta hydrolase [Candidatus Woesearchaeota archaeon]|nr:alpha/beta hydrolase [Candidatus Woesearchaeota archaeon]